MKSLQLIAHTTGGVVLSAVEQVTERDYEVIKEGLRGTMGRMTCVEFNTDEGWVIIPGASVLYVDLKVY